MSRESPRVTCPGAARALLPILLVLGATVVEGGAEPEPLAVYRELHAPRLDGRRIEVTDLPLSRDVFELSFTDGSFHLLEPVAGKTPGAVFIGSGSYRLTPSSAVERYHLGVRTGSPGLTSLSDRFGSAVLLFDDGTEAELLAAGSPSEGAEEPRAREALDRRLGSETGIDFALRLLRARLNDEGRSGGPFFALVDGERLPEAVLAVDPAGLLDDEGVCLMDARAGAAGYWYSSRLRGAPPGAGGRLVNALHYEVESRVARSTDLIGETKVHFEVLAPSLRVLPVDLHPSLEVREAELLAAAEAPVPTAAVTRTTEGAAVLFSEPLPHGSKAVLRLAYAGDEVLVDDGSKIYQVRGRTNWYANLGALRDRATYELTFRVPTGSTVIAVGEPVSTTSAEGETVSVWRSTEPITVAGFNYGDFEHWEHHEENTDTALEVWATAGTPDVITEINQQLRDASEGLDFRQSLEVATNDAYTAYVNTYTGPSSVGVSPEAVAEVAMADAINSVQVFTRYFGPLSTRRIAVTQQSQWSFGQAWPSLVYFPYLLGLSSLLDLELGLPGYAGFVDEVGIHEMAHQWWGHQVGWASYRDQWLSEGFAEFSTALVLELTQGAEAYDRFWARRRQALLGRPRGAAAPAAAAGPLTLGFRATSPDHPAAARVLMYSKGAYVLQMLRAMMRDPKSGSDERFFAMMRDFATTWAGRDASTEDFEATVEKHMPPSLDARGDGSVDWFFDQWVHGVEVPRYEANVRVEKAGKGRYRLVGTLTQASVSEGFVALVPAHVDLGKDGLAQFGRAPFVGEMSHDIDVTLELPRKPKAVLLNGRYEVLAYD